MLRNNALNAWVWFLIETSNTRQEKLPASACSEMASICCCNCLRDSMMQSSASNWGRSRSSDANLAGRVPPGELLAWSSGCSWPHRWRRCWQRWHRNTYSPEARASFWRKERTADNRTDKSSPRDAHEILNEGHASYFQWYGATKLTDDVSGTVKTTILRSQQLAASKRRNITVLRLRLKESPTYTRPNVDASLSTTDPVWRQRRTKDDARVKH